MNEYISREAMLKNLTSDLEHHSDEGDPRTCLVMRRFIKYVEDFPAADVQPVKRGRWESSQRTIETGTVYCSNCAIEYYISALQTVGDCYGIVHYCPNCGARMDGDKNG